jgi:hypothetical protein
MQGTADTAKKDSAAVAPEASSPYNWLERTEAATVGRLLPEDNRILNWVNEHVAQPPVKMGKEVGNIAASKGLEGIAYTEEGLGNLEAKIFNAPNMKREIPSWAKGNEGAYLKYRYEQENPRLAGMTTSLFNFAGELVGNPTNWPLMGAGEAKSAVMKVFNKAFGYQMGVQAVSEGKDLWDNWDKMSTEQRWRGMTDLFIHTVAAREALKGHPVKVEGPETATGKRPTVSKPTRAQVLANRPVEVAGEPVTKQTIAGVEVPVSAQHAESVSKGTEPRENEPIEATSQGAHEIKQYQRKQTAPVATAAAHSILGQSAEDMINQHDAVINGEPTPESVVEAGKPSKYETIDDAANALNTKARQTTYAKADEISEREQAEWQRKVEIAHQNEQAGIDHYNQMVDEHNANLQEGDEPMQHETFDPSKVQVPERPKTYGELKGAVDRAYADLKSPDAEVRENAVDAIDKAEKNLDNWFKQHSDEISPDEYTSAKKLVYAGARLQEIANSLRSAIDNDSLTGNKLRSVISAIDNRMQKRGEPVGAFRRLVGDDVYDNWRKMSRLFDPIQEAPRGLKSLGHLALHFAVHHFLGGLGLVGKVGAHWLLDRVLGTPAWGAWFSDLAQSVKDKISKGAEIPQRILDNFKSLWDGLKNREEGAVGAKITPRTAGSPVPPKFGRAGLGGGGSVLEEAMKPGPSGFPEATVEPKEGPQQEFTSEGTSLNQVPALHKGIAWQPGTTNFDLGGGKYDTATEHLADKGVTNHVIDPFNRTAEHNDAVQEAIRRNPTDTGTLANVLNVVKEPEVRQQILQQLADGVKPGGKVYISTYEGSGSGEGAPSTRGWQENRNTASYLDEVKQVFPDAHMEGKTIVGTVPEAQTGEKAGPYDHIPVNDKATSEISTRYSPDTAAGTNNPEHMPTMDAIEEAQKSDPNYIKKLVDSLRGYADNNGLPLEEDGRTNRQVLSDVVDHIHDNLRWLYENTPGYIRGVSKQWYETAHRMTSQMADKYGISHEKMAAVVAALSPKNGWDNNVGIADRLVDMWKNYRTHAWDADMAKTFNRLTDGDLKPAFRQMYEDIRGLSYDDIDKKFAKSSVGANSARKALWLRIMDESINKDRKTPVYAPNGEIRGSRTLTWGMPDPAAKAIQVLEGNGSIEHINSMMGKKNKIRSFYNNIINPNSARGHVTIDTHAVAAGLLKVLSSNDDEVLHNFGGAPANKPTGLDGTYSVYAAAYRKAAAALGIQPRELQSITWEAIRSLFPDYKKKDPAFRQLVQNEWDRYKGKPDVNPVQAPGADLESRAKKGVKKENITLDQVRDNILRAVGGFDRPQWDTTEGRRVRSQGLMNEASENEEEPDLTKMQNQMATLQGAQHSISADVAPHSVDPAVLEKWKGKPAPLRQSTPNGRPRASWIDDLADHLNANYTPQEVLQTTSHEVAHALIQHELGTSTDDAAMHLGNRALVKGRKDVDGIKATINGVSGGGWAPGKGWQERFDKAQSNPEELKNTLRDYVTQLMGGRAIEEMTGMKPSDVDIHTHGDEQMAKRILSKYHVPGFMHRSLMADATNRAKAILHDKWETVQHLSAQLSNHFGGNPVDSATFHNYRQGGTYQK